VTYPDQADPLYRDPAFGDAPSPGAPPWINALTLPAASGNLIGGACRYFGFSLRETAGAAALINLYSGSGTGSGELLDTIQFSANQSVREWYAPGGIAANGIYVELVSGSVAGSIRVLAE
jgi:hypothetical protein